jgi:hypothetical protein
VNRYRPSFIFVSLGLPLTLLRTPDQMAVDAMTSSFTSAQRQKLLENGRAQRDAIDRQDQVLDFETVVKLLLPTATPPGSSLSLTPTLIWLLVFATWASVSPKNTAAAAQNECQVREN